MLLTSKQIQALRNELGAMGWSLRIQAEPSGAWGYVSPAYKRMMIVNKAQGFHGYKDAQGKASTTDKHDPRKTLAHEYTHILQIKAGYYRDGRGGTNEERYNYNEVIANTIGMLLYPTDSNIIDNAGYVNGYIMKGVGGLMKHLEDDINKFYPEVKTFMERIGA